CVTWTEQEILKKSYPLNNTCKDSAFKNLIQRIHETKSTITIHHSFVEKPDQKYYELKNNFSKGKRIIFFDNKQENVAGATAAGFLAFKVNSCAQMVKVLENLSLLSRQKEPRFFNRPSLDGVFGQLKKYMTITKNWLSQMF